MPDPLPEYGQCVHKVAVDAARPDRLYAQNHCGVFRIRRRRERRGRRSPTGLPGRLRLPDRRLADAPPGTAWVVPLVADMQRVPPDGPAARAPHPRRGGDLDRAGRRACPTAAGRRCCGTRSAPTTADPTGIYLGTRDGCVYASADEGDTFTAVADHLPDVLTVRRPRCRDASRCCCPGVLAGLAGGARRLDVDAARGHRRGAARRARGGAPAARPPASATRPARCGGS